MSIDNEVTREYAKLDFGTLCDLLSEKKNTLILCHVRPDCDAVGSAFALRLLLEKTGIHAWCVCDNEMPHRLAFIMEGLQESILDSAVPNDFEFERIISVDTASPNQLGMLKDKYLKIDCMIDHHGKGIQYADGYIVPNAAATGEIIFDVSRELLHRGVIENVGTEIDKRIYAAISSDTGCFRYSSVTPETHIRAAELLKSGIDAAEINHKLFDCKPFIQMKAEKLGFDRLHVYDNGKISILEFPYDVKAENGIEDQYLETLIDVARGVEGVEIAAAIRQPQAEGKFRCSMRSNCAFDVSKVCAGFGGGGHTKAAGCDITANDVHEAAQKLLDMIRKYR